MNLDRKHLDLKEIARNAMSEQGLTAQLPRAAQAELERIHAPAAPEDGTIRDLRDLPWISIDNDDSRDLDQLGVAEDLGGGRIRVLIAIADVDALVPKGSELDKHAGVNTTSVYTPGHIFPMLPEKLSTDFTSLNPGEDRLAMVVEMIVDDGRLEGETVLRGHVRNRAQLAYESVAEWLEGTAEMPEAMAAFPPAAEQARLQDAAAAKLRSRRQEEGALDFETIEAKAKVSDGEVVSIERRQQTRAHQIIEDFMIAANGISARFLQRRKLPTIRRVVRSPERWGRIVALAEEYRHKLPQDPDPVALEEFLLIQKKKDPVTFPDLSLSIIKLMGRGEYVAQKAGSEPPGHFGLAVRDYTHSTAPNRRYPDLVTQRLLKAAIAGEKSPYNFDELVAIADHCTKQENAADKVERLATKAAAAIHLQNRIGEEFQGVITGASAKGVWVRTFDPPVEGKVVSGDRGLDVGDRVRVKLVGANPERGWIDFARR
ncbi:MAG: RNB domain-containing ribonuclease [Thermoanaerobaculia bacterium]